MTCHDLWLSAVFPVFNMIRNDKLHSIRFYRQIIPLTNIGSQPRGNLYSWLPFTLRLALSKLQPLAQSSFKVESHPPITVNLMNTVDKCGNTGGNTGGLKMVSLTRKVAAIRLRRSIASNVFRSPHHVYTISRFWGKAKQAKIRKKNHSFLKMDRGRSRSTVLRLAVRSILIGRKV